MVQAQSRAMAWPWLVGVRLQAARWLPSARRLERLLCRAMDSRPLISRQHRLLRAFGPRPSRLGPMTPCCGSRARATTARSCPSR